MSSNQPAPPQLAVALDAARVGGEVVARYYRDGVEIRSKESYNLVTDADVNAEHAIVDVIRRTFPNHTVLGEESYSADPLGDHVWIIDPIDGTNNFAHAVPHFAVSVAYYEQGRPICGVVHNPVTDDWYHCYSGGGAWSGERRIQVGQQTQLSEVLVGVGFYYDRGAMMECTLAAISELFGQHIHGIRRFGTASLDLCMVGLGLFGAYFEFQLSPWDFAAGRLFVEEAGGRVTDCRGQPLPLTKTSVLATNGALHAQVLAITDRHHPDEASST